jgi:hypothetical protein
MRLTDNEKLELWGMRHNFASADVGRAVGEFTQGISDLLESSDPANVYRALAGIEQVKAMFQRMHNYSHTVGMLAAKAFLESEFPDVPWETFEFAEDANRKGADLRISEFHIVAELKTTEPCGKSKTGTAPTKFGGQQKENIEKDLRKLSAPENDGFNKYMFVTSGLAYHCLIRDYRAAFGDICFVLLSALPEVSRPVAIEAKAIAS